MTAPRKPKTNSTENVIRVFAGANIEIAPPAHVPLDDDDMPHWHSIVDEFAKVDWTRHSLDLAAILARTIADLERAQRQLRKEGSVVIRGDGTTAANPLVNVVKSYTAMVLAIRRSLGLSARIRAGGSVHAAKQRIHNRAIERLASSEDDDLLA